MSSVSKKDETPKFESLADINQKTKQAYNKAAEKYQQLFFDELDKKEFDKNYLDKFSKHFDSNSIICDAGCGPCGHIAKYLTDKGVNVIGIDISEKCIEIAQKNFPTIRFEVGDFCKLNFRDNYFDGIISYYSVIDTPKIYLNKVMREFNRVLKIGGYLLLVVKEGATEGFQSDLLGIETEIYFSLFTEKEIEYFLKSNNFKIIKIEQRNPYADEISINRIFSISKKII
jgi:ubiquinone/menaquinone biosynthesis C-methylase UbiE